MAYMESCLHFHPYYIPNIVLFFRVDTSIPDENNIATTLTTESFTFKKGYRKVININLQDSTNKPIDSGFNVSFTEPKLTDEDPVNFDFTL